MKRFTEVRQELAEKMSAGAAQVRTNYQCRAHGCPNAGSMDGDVCYWHWRESDPAKWAGMTTKVRDNFDRMKNWDFNG